THREASPVGLEDSTHPTFNPLPEAERGSKSGRASVSLVRNGTPRAASAMRLSLVELIRWAESATTHQFQGLQAARCGAQVLLRGRLRPLAGERFWGRRVLLPLGWRLEPNLPEGVLLAGMRLAAGEIVLFTGSGVEVVPAGAFGPVTRAGV